MVNQLVIVSGASRGIGKAFFDSYKNAIGISRTTGEKLDLMDSNATLDFVRNLNLTGVERLVYLHSVGMDKFEPHGKPHIDYDKDGIDDEVLASNLTTFQNFVEPLLDKVQIPTTICAVGSISDIFNVPFWHSFSRSKNRIRKFLKSLCRGNVKGLVLNVSSTLDEEGRRYGRINADTTYWQTAKELVAKSSGILDSFQEIDANYAEFDFFKHDPSFTRDYFTNLPRLYERWQRELGYEGKEVPIGIRI